MGKRKSVDRSTGGDPKSKPDTLLKEVKKAVASTFGIVTRSKARRSQDELERSLGQLSTADTPEAPRRKRSRSQPTARNGSSGHRTAGMRDCFQPPHLRPIVCLLQTFRSR